MTGGLRDTILNHASLIFPRAPSTIVVYGEGAVWHRAQVGTINRVGDADGSKYGRGLVVDGCCGSLSTGLD